ncbi:MAG: hypothetical protein J0L92_04370 [Deltaproteobacteria bacterium]|nr:hypothetical protein [Deltaproteobacteria bacterium]
MIASAAREALALTLASLEDPALEDVRLEGARNDGKSVHATFACPAEVHAAAHAALTRVERRLASELAVELDRKRALRLTWSLLTEDELALAALVGGER